MRITFKTEGGLAHFPGLAQPMTLDSADLAPEDASTLSRLVDAARFFEQAPQVGATRGADLRLYTLRVEDGPRSHEIRVSDLHNDTALQELIDFLTRLKR